MMYTHQLSFAVTLTQAYTVQATYFRTIRKSTAVVRMTKLENSTAIAWNKGEEQLVLR